MNKSKLLLLERIYNAGIKLATGAFHTSSISSLVAELHFKLNLQKRRLSYVCRLICANHLREYEIFGEDGWFGLESNLVNIFYNFCIKYDLDPRKFILSEAIPTSWNFIPPYIDLSMINTPKSRYLSSHVKSKAMEMIKRQQSTMKIFNGASKASERVGF